MFHPRFLFETTSAAGTSGTEPETMFLRIPKAGPTKKKSPVTKERRKRHTPCYSRPVSKDIESSNERIQCPQKAITRFQRAHHDLEGLADTIKSKNRALLAGNLQPLSSSSSVYMR